MLVAMKLQQLRYIVEVARHDLNVSLTAESLYTSQPGISKQIRLLEDELDIEIFERSGKHFVQITDVGKEVISQAEQILLQVENIRRLAREHLAPEHGKLDIAMSHLHARYLLPQLVGHFKEQYPQVVIHLHQHSPRQMLQRLLSGRADFALSSWPISDHPELIGIPFCRWKRVLIAPEQHPLTQRNELTLGDIALYPLVAYVSSCGRLSGIENFFREQGVEPTIGSSVCDLELVVRYVEQGAGVGIIPGTLLADRPLASGLKVLSLGFDFPDEVGVIMFRRHRFLRQYMLDFISLCNPSLSKAQLQQQLQRPQQEWTQEVLANLPCLG